MNHLADKMNLAPLAAYSYTGTLLLEPSKRGKGHDHGHVQNVFGTDPSLCIEVGCTTLDDFARKNPRPDLVKIDVEGYEGFVIDGAKETLHRVETLAMEFSPALLKGAGRDPALTLHTLTGYFSRLYRIERAELVKVTTNDCLESDKLMELIFER